MEKRREIRYSEKQTLNQYNIYNILIIEDSSSMIKIIDNIFSGKTKLGFITWKQNILEHIFFILSFLIYY